MFYLTARPNDRLEVKQIVLGEAYEFTDFDSYELSEQCSPYMDDIPYNTLIADLRTEEKTKIHNGMTVYNRINGKPFGKFNVETFEQTDENMYSLRANDFTARLDGITYNGTIYCEYDGSQFDTSDFFCLFKVRTGIPIYENYKSYPISMTTGVQSIDKAQLNTRGYCNVMSYRKALVIYAQAMASICLSDRLGKIRLLNEKKTFYDENLVLKNEGTLSFEYTPTPQYTYDSNDVMGKAIFQEAEKCKSIEFVMHDLLYSNRNKNAETVFTINLPPKGQGGITVTFSDFYASSYEVFKAGTSTKVRVKTVITADSEIVLFPIKLTLECTDETFSGGLVDIKIYKVPEQIVNESVELAESGFEYSVDNTLLSSRNWTFNTGYKNIGAFQLVYWLQNVLNSPGTVSASVIFDPENVPRLGDTVQIETAWQGIKQGMITSIVMGAEDIPVADVKILCFREYDVDGDINPIFARLNGG